MAVKYIYIKEGHKPSFFHIISFMEILNMASQPHSSNRTKKFIL